MQHSAQLTLQHFQVDVVLQVDVEVGHLSAQPQAAPQQLSKAWRAGVTSKARQAALNLNLQHKQEDCGLAEQQQASQTGEYTAAHCRLQWSAIEWWAGLSLSQHLWVSKLSC
jgi:hypothetical protein